VVTTDSHNVNTLICCLVQLLNLRGLGWIYRQSIFLYIMYGIVGLSFALFAIKGPEPFKRQKPEDVYKS
jgi:hypothetical protein